MLVWILGPKFVERASVLHRSDNVGSQRHHIVPFGELNGVLIALVARWFEKMESIFHIYDCAKNFQVKYIACTLLDGALTWWNAYAQSVGIDAAYETTWKELKKMMTEEYCPKNEL
ncbi:hypothetical protein Tco_1430455 [Tanacetum coccineum]